MKAFRGVVVIMSAVLAACATGTQGTTTTSTGAGTAPTAATMGAGAGAGGGPGDAQFFPPNARGALSDAVKVGNMLYLSGQLGRDSASGGIAGETRSSLMRIKTLLERHGSSMERVVKCTVFLLDMNEWAAMNQVYVTFFPTSKPARSAVGTNGLVGGARVEIECMATVP